MRKTWGKTLMFTLASGALAISGCNNHTEKPIKIETGEVGYTSSAPIESHGFNECSALILDTGEGAIMAHAFYITPRGAKNPYRSSGYIVDIGNAVDKSVEELSKYGINPQDCEAIIVAGTEDAMETLKGDLSRFSIPIRTARVGKGDSRSVSYNSRTNTLNEVDSGFSEGKFRSR